MPLEPLDLIRLHLNLECVGVDLAGQLVRIPCADPDTLHRVYVTRHVNGGTMFFKAGLPQVIRDNLLQLPSTDFFDFPERVKAVLEPDGPCEELHIGKSYVFPGNLDASQYPDVVRCSQIDLQVARQFNPQYEPGQREVFAVVVGGKITATCESSRENGFAGEAWVQTLEPYRRRGFARQCTLAWAYWLQQHGKVPFYSHKWENLASQALAQSLGLIKFIEDAGYA